MSESLQEIIGHLSAAKAQRAPSDDAIIAEHVDAALRIAESLAIEPRHPVLDKIRARMPFVDHRALDCGTPEPRTYITLSELNTLRAQSSPTTRENQP